MARCKSSVSSLWSSTELIVERMKFRVKNPSVFIVYKYNLTLILVVFWRDFFLVALYFPTVLLSSFLIWFSHFYDPILLIPGVEWGCRKTECWMGTALKTVTGLLPAVSANVFFDLYLQTNSLKPSLVCISSELKQMQIVLRELSKGTWDVHVHKIKDSFCCLRNPLKSHLRTFTGLEQCQRGSKPPGQSWQSCLSLEG